MHTSPNVVGSVSCHESHDVPAQVEVDAGKSSREQHKEVQDRRMSKIGAKLQGDMFCCFWEGMFLFLCRDGNLVMCMQGRSMDSFGCRA